MTVHTQTDTQVLIKLAKKGRRTKDISFVAGRGSSLESAITFYDDINNKYNNKINNNTSSYREE